MNHYINFGFEYNKDITLLCLRIRYKAFLCGERLLAGLSGVAFPKISQEQT